MKRVAVIPGVGVGEEIFRFLLPLLKGLTPGIEWLELSIENRLSRLETRKELVRALLAKMGSLAEQELIDRQTVHWLSEDPRLAFAKFRELVYKEQLSDSLVQEIWKSLGVGLNPEQVATVLEADACLFGTAGENTGWVLMWLRNAFQLYANVRPIRSLESDLDFVIVRENTEGMYTQIERRDGSYAAATRIITGKASRRIAQYAANLAVERQGHGHVGKVSVVHKANVLPQSCGLFRETAMQVMEAYPTLKVDEYYVDAFSYLMMKDPSRFDVVVTTNLFGDIVSDTAAYLMGSLGNAASGNYGERFALFEPVHGSAPDIAGQDLANPVGSIESAAMLLDYLDYSEAAGRLRSAVKQVYQTGVRTRDIGGSHKLSEVMKAVEKAL